MSSLFCSSTIASNRVSSEECVYLCVSNRKSLTLPLLLHGKFITQACLKLTLPQAISQSLDLDLGDGEKDEHFDLILSFCLFFYVGCSE